MRASFLWDLQAVTAAAAATADESQLPTAQKADFHCSDMETVLTSGSFDVVESALLSVARDPKATATTVESQPAAAQIMVPAAAAVKADDSQPPAAQSQEFHW